MENNNIESGQSNESKKELVQTAYKYSELTSKIIKCAMTVHNELGCGFQEVIYQRALEIEFGLQGIEFSREYEIIQTKKSG